MTSQTGRTFTGSSCSDLYLSPLSHVSSRDSPRSSSSESSIAPPPTASSVQRTRRFTAEAQRRNACERTQPNLASAPSSVSDMPSSDGSFNSESEPDDSSVTAQVGVSSQPGNARSRPPVPEHNNEPAKIDYSNARKIYQAMPPFDNNGDLNNLVHRQGRYKRSTAK